MFEKKRFENDRTDMAVMADRYGYILFVQSES
jgi:hypothetical protein